MLDQVLARIHGARRCDQYMTTEARVAGDQSSQKHLDRQGNDAVGLVFADHDGLLPPLGLADVSEPGFGRLS